MTTERAKAELEQIYGILSSEKQQALDVAFKALEQEPCDDFLSREERLKMLMETGEFEFLKGIPSDTIWKLVFMLEFIGNAESEVENEKK